MALARPDLDVFRFYNVEMMERLAEEFKQRGIPDDPQPFKPRRAAKSAAS
jgi:hypothetical protein